LPVGREERVNGSLRAGDRLGLQAVHRPEVKPLRAAFNGVINKKAAIGRKNYSRAGTGTNIQLLARR
jgi:hypothetical protein